jgi:hypothetical protein
MNIVFLVHNSATLLLTLREVHDKGWIHLDISKHLCATFGFVTLFNCSMQAHELINICDCMHAMKLHVRKEVKPTSCFNSALDAEIG